MSPYRIVIEVSADYIGDLLSDRLPVLEYAEAVNPGSGDVTSTYTAEYELTIPEYDALLAQLADREELPAEEVFNTTSTTVLVIVRQ